ncbi:MAG: hypothetical protein AB7P17_15165 [Nitrospirales bacterium]|nr:hypothetical protein [Nitrospirales bacterium]
MFHTPKHLADINARRRTLAPYFGLGFRRTTLDSRIFQEVVDHFLRHKDRFFLEQNIPYVQTIKKNYSPALLVGDSAFNQQFLRELKFLHEEWSGMELKEAACYGIRVYQPGSYLFNHVDRTETHIISSTICVAHHLTKPWPLYIEDIDGHPHEISMEPGDIVFYEGAKLMHGRPYPLEGRFYAGLFLHYTPVKGDGSVTELP